jgi:ABC-type Fe3+-citrate transport system substrate-binding protein
VLPEIATVPTGLAPRVPVNGEPSDVDTEKVATVVPAAELSGRDAAVGVKLMPVGVADVEATTVIIKVAALLNAVFIPIARIRTG